MFFFFWGGVLTDAIPGQQKPTAGPPGWAANNSHWLTTCAAKMGEARIATETGSHMGQVPADDVFWMGAEDGDRKAASWVTLECHGG